MVRTYLNVGDKSTKKLSGTRNMKKPKVHRMKRAKVDKVGFARRVRELRKKLGISQPALGKALGVPQQTVQNWESGKVGRTGHIIALARALCTSPEWLQFEEGEKEVRPFRPLDQILRLYEELGEEKAGVVIEFMRALLRKPIEDKPARKGKKQAA